MEDFDERLLSARTLSAEDETERSLRPHRLDEYVGQENVKELLKVYIEAAKQKKAWCRNNLSSTVTVLPVLGGTKKFLFMNNPNDILIDDFPKNIDTWVKHNGAGILHTDFALTRSRLKELLIIT